MAGTPVLRIGRWSAHEKAAAASRERDARGARCALGGQSGLAFRRAPVLVLIAAPVDSSEYRRRKLGAGRILDASTRLIVRFDWDGTELASSEQVTFDLSLRSDLLHVEVSAPWFGDPLPPAPPGGLEGLWNHEVAELFVAGAGGYLELELGPGGHHLALFFRNVRAREARFDLDDVQVERKDARWTGQMSVPLDRLPRGPWSANAFSLHGPPEGRRHRVAHLLPGKRPDFHQPAAFPPLPPGFDPR